MRRRGAKLKITSHRIFIATKLGKRGGEGEREKRARVNGIRKEKRGAHLAPIGDDSSELRGGSKAKKGRRTQDTRVSTEGG